MKKLVWREMRLRGGQRFRGPLSRPPGAAGPFQDVGIEQTRRGAAPGPDLYRDIRVIAFRSRRMEASWRPAAVVTSGGTSDPSLLRDGRYATALKLTRATDGTAWVTYDLGRSRMLRSTTVGLPGPRGFGTPSPPLARLSVSADGKTYRDVVSLLPTQSPARSASFPAVVARYARLTIRPDPAPSFAAGLATAPGAILPAFGTATPQPFALSEFCVTDEARVTAAEEKAGFATLPDYYASVTPPMAGVDPASVIDVSDHLAADGTFDWRPPSGTWTVLRLGWSLTGRRNGPAPADATGLEVDKLSAGRVRAYIRDYLAVYRDAVGERLLGQAGLRALLSDSIESGPQNWTEDLFAQFRTRRGYDPSPWLPALTGFVVGDSDRTERFLWDWRRTIADLVADAYYRVIAEEAHRAGMILYAEALEDRRPQLGDDLDMRAASDVPMGAMWYVAEGARPNATYVADIKGAASVANIYGQQAVGAESMSAFGRPWAFAPRDLKRTVDAAFALGVNRIVVHTSAHQPMRDAPPGLALSPMLGQYFTRNETWAEFARPWIDYLARTSFLLQQGRHAADIAYFYGEEAPLTALFGDSPPGDVPAGYDFDFVNATALDRMTIDNGTMVTPAGVRYRILYLGGASDRLTLRSLRRIHQLAAAGVAVVGRPPARSPSLADDADEVAAMIGRIWRGGSLRVFATPEQAVAALRIASDWRWTGDRTDLAPSKES